MEMVMQPSPVKQSSFFSLAHIAIDEPLKKQIEALNGQASSYSMDQFYIEMLEQLSPAAQKQRYLDQLSKNIQALFRIDRVIVAAFYTDNTIQCFDDEVSLLINSIDEAPLTISRVSFILYNHYAGRSSLDYYSADYPTQLDFNKGYLFNDADLKAGFSKKEETLEELMCDWLQHYQLWMQDYLYFNLAQVKTDNHKNHLTNVLKPLLDSNQYIETETARLLLK